MFCMPTYVLHNYPRRGYSDEVNMPVGPSVRRSVTPKSREAEGTASWNFIIPRETVGYSYELVRLSVCPSVRPSVCLSHNLVQTISRRPVVGLI